MREVFGADRLLALLAEVLALPPDVFCLVGDDGGKQLSGEALSLKGDFISLSTANASDVPLTLLELMIRCTQKLLDTPPTADHVNLDLCNLHIPDTVLVSLLQLYSNTVCFTALPSVHFTNAGICDAML